MDCHFTPSPKSKEQRLLTVPYWHMLDFSVVAPPGGKQATVACIVGGFRGAKYMESMGGMADLLPVADLPPCSAISFAFEVPVADKKALTDLAVLKKIVLARRAGFVKGIEPAPGTRIAVAAHPIGIAPVGAGGGTGGGTAALMRKMAAPPAEPSGFDFVEHRRSPAAGKSAQSAAVDLMPPPPSKPTKVRWVVLVVC